jgi:hypothetical protein
MPQNELERDAWRASYGPVAEMTSSGSTQEVLATRRFDRDDLDAAYAERDERYATGEAGPPTPKPVAELLLQLPRLDVLEGYRERAGSLRAKVLRLRRRARWPTP